MHLARPPKLLIDGKLALSLEKNLSLEKIEDVKLVCNIELISILNSGDCL